MAILPSTGLTVSAVRTALQASSTDVGTLCKHVNINQWAYYKPFSYAAVSIDNYSYSYASGMEIIDGSNFGPNTTERKYWEFKYIKPSGGANSPYRLGDFKGYNHDAKPPKITNTYGTSPLAIQLGANETKIGEVSVKLQHPDISPNKLPMRPDNDRIIRVYGYVNSVKKILYEAQYLTNASWEPVKNTIQDIKLNFDSSWVLPTAFQKFEWEAFVDINGVRVANLPIVVTRQRAQDGYNEAYWNTTLPYTVVAHSYTGYIGIYNTLGLAGSNTDGSMAASDAYGVKIDRFWCNVGTANWTVKVYASSDPQSVANPTWRLIAEYPKALFTATGIGNASYYNGASSSWKGLTKNIVIDTATGKYGVTDYIQLSRTSWANPPQQIKVEAPDIT